MKTKRNGRTKEKVKTANRGLRFKGVLRRSFASVMLGVAFMPCAGAFALATGSEAEYPGDNLGFESSSVEESLATTAFVETTTTSATSITSTTSATTSTTTSASATTTTTSETTTTVSTEVAVAETETTIAEPVSYEFARVSDEELVMLAKTLAQEGGDCSYAQQCCVIWTVLNRVDSWEWPNTVSENLLKPNQFAYYSWKEYREDHYRVVLDVVSAWENDGERLLGPDYQYFYGDGYRNHFYGKNSSEVVPD